MSNYQPLRYHFHASGYALSAHFDRPVDVPIAAQASLALPIEGGQAHSGIENFAIPRIAAFDAAQTHLSGSFQDEEENTATTSVTVVVEGLSLLDFLTVDRMVTRLTGEHNLKQKNGESHIIALGSHFEDLKLGGHAVNVTLRHDLLLEAKTFENLKKAVKDDTKSGRIMIPGNEVLLFSLVDKIETDLPGAVIEGHTIEVPHFGKIALAEVFAGRGIRTLTMLRFQLGSPDGGGGTGGGGTTNGSPFGH